MDLWSCRKTAISSGGLYPEALNVRVLTDEYETVDIGLIPVGNEVRLEQVAQWALSGLRIGRPGLELNGVPNGKSLGGVTALRFEVFWVFKNGTKIHEQIALLRYKAIVYSVTVRAADSVVRARGDLLQGIVGSFQPFDADVNMQ